MARGAKIIIMTDERIKEKLSNYADLYGMTVSALGAYILGHWVNQQEKVEPFFAEFRKFSEHLAEMIWDDATKRASDSDYLEGIICDDATKRTSEAKRNGS